MTSTNVFSGNFADKPSSRVLKPPGGGNSNIFGGPEETPLPPCNKRPQQVQVDNKAVPSQDSAAKQTTSDIQKQVSSEPIAKLETEKKSDSTYNVTNNNKAKNNCNSDDSTKSYKSRMQGSFNPITGEPYGKVTNVPGESKPVSSITVKQPPGGASTKLW